MSTPKPFVGGNWKMNTTRETAAALAESVTANCDKLCPAVDVAVFVPFPYLLTVGDVLRDSPISLGAQDIFHEPDGAFTGEVSAEMLIDCGVTFVLTGHSERRHVIGEDDTLVNKKTQAALDAGLAVIFCLGETKEQRQAGETEQIITEQLSLGLEGIFAPRMSQVTIAYEPVWAIGTGDTASPDDAESAHRVLRAALETMYNKQTAGNVRIQYGGSVKPDNALELFERPYVDGGLIGGASLSAEDFTAICQAAAEIAQAKTG